MDKQLFIQAARAVCADHATKLAIDRAKQPSLPLCISDPETYLHQRLAEIFAAHPDLTDAGYKWRRVDGTIELDDQPAPTIEVRLCELYAATMFLDQFCTPLPSAYPSSPSSYRLKHAAERFARSIGEPMHVPNGVLILAALLLGYPVRRYDPDSPNALIGVRVKKAERRLPD